MCLREAHKAAQGMCLIGRWENKHGRRCPGDVGQNRAKSWTLETLIILLQCSRVLETYPAPVIAAPSPPRTIQSFPPLQGKPAQHPLQRRNRSTAHSRHGSSAASRTSKANNWLLGPASSLTTSATQCLHEHNGCFVLVVFPN